MTSQNFSFRLYFMLFFFQSLVARKVVLAVNNGAPSSSVIKSQRFSCPLLSWFVVLIYLIVIMFIIQSRVSR
jgi:hypothetical protein